MTSENVLRNHLGLHEGRKLGLQESGGLYTQDDAATPPSYPTTEDSPYSPPPPRQNAIRSRGYGRRPSSAPPMYYTVSTYYFSSLRDGYIRLLRLMPYLDEHSPIQCQLFDYSLLDSGKGTHLYEALSYVWGSTERTRSISINEGHLRITENLYAALSRLRDRSLPRILWIDAICIDQNNIEERNRQVQSMARIYTRASRVIVWLEETTPGGSQVDKGATTDTDRALEVISKAATEDRSTVLLENQQAVRTLLQRSWFRRIWVLQEVAAARHVLIMSRSTEIDGYAFCSGWNALKNTSEKSVTQSRIHSTVYLVKDAVLRPKHATSHSDRFSLHIRPLGELIDMYHDREASDLRDKVYALLGMSSDLPVGITPDYGRRWKELFCHLVKSLIGEQATVETWDEEDMGDQATVKEEIAKIAIIKSKCCVLGKVFKKDDTRGDGQRVDITWKSHVGTKGEQSSHFTFPASAKPIQVGDAVCLLEGTSKPTIVRPCNGYSAIIMIAVPLTDDSQPTSIKWLELLRSITTFPNDILLVWDWDVSRGMSQVGEGYERLISSREGPKCSRIECKCRDHMDKAIRLWNFGLLLNGMERYKEAGKNLRKAVEFYGTAVGNSHGPWEKAVETLKMDFLLLEDKGAAIEAKCKDGQTPLSWAAGEGHEPVVRLLLDKGADVNAEGLYSETPLSRAAGEGHEPVVRLLLDKGADVNAEARPLQRRIRRWLGQ